jgi:NADH-quinone oxidoreductase subunit M
LCFRQSSILPKKLILSLLIFVPLIASGLLLALPANLQNTFRWINLGVCFLQFCLCLWLYVSFDTTNANYQFVEQYNWITLPLGGLGVVSIDYLLGIDGISLPMVLLAGLVMLIGAISSFEISSKLRAYHALYLLLSASIMGCFVALDLFLFFLFFEFMLLPMYFLIGLWGGPRRDYASIKFLLYTLVGSICILLVMIGLYISAIDPIETAILSGSIPNRNAASPEVIKTIQTLLAQGSIPSEQLVHTFDLRYLSDIANYAPDSWLGVLSEASLAGIPARMLAFLLLMFGFAIKLPAIPVHTWLPDAHVEAPTPVSVVLAGILLKIGAYGFFRIGYDIFPDGAINYASFLGVLGAVSIVYGAMNALAQNDLKRLIAYSSVSHMGFVLLGLASLTAEGLNGAIYQMFSHGILSAMLFLIAGVLYSRTHDRRIDSYRGIASRVPVYTAVTAVAFFASLGLPAFSGFVGEFFSMMGAFNSKYVSGYAVVLSGLGLVLGAGYFLWTLQKIFFGQFWMRPDSSLLSDLSYREKLMLIPLSLLALVFGIFPQLIFDVCNATINEFLKQF